MQSIRERVWQWRYMIIVILPIALLISGSWGFPFPSETASFSDVAISHYPNAIYLRASVLAKDFPFWSPQILSGSPFAANPLASLWYPLHYLVFLFRLPLGLNVGAMAHLVIAGGGMWLYLKSKALSEASAALGAMLFVGMPKLFAHFGAGHLTVIYAVSWTPWLMLAIESKRNVWFRQPGLILAMIFLADPRWAAYGGILWLMWVIADRHTAVWGRVKNFGVQLGLAFLLSAPLAFPLLILTRASTRATLTVSDVLSLSLPPAQILGLIFPNYGSNHELVSYYGVVSFAFVLIAIVTSVRTKLWFWLGLVGGSLIYSLGAAIPGMSILASLPGFSLLRVPSRALFLTGFGMAVIAAYVLDYLWSLHSEIDIKRYRLMIVFALVFVIVIGVFAQVVLGKVSLPFVIGPTILFAVWACIELWLARRISFNFFLVLVFAITLLDLSVMNYSLFTYRSSSAVLADGADAAEWLVDQNGEFRVYSPSYSIPQQTAAYYGLQLADGVDPLQLASYAEYMDAATGIPREGYSVTIPPFAYTDEDGDISQTNVSYIPDLDLLAGLNVRYIVSAFPVDISAELVHKTDKVYIYENLAKAEPVTFNLLGYERAVITGVLAAVLGIGGLIWLPYRAKKAGGYRG